MNNCFGHLKRNKNVFERKSHRDTKIEEAETKPLLAVQDAEECLERLEKNINDHDETLVEYEKAASVWNDKRIDSLMQQLNDHKEQMNNENAEQINHISEAIESVESILKEIQTLMRFQSSLKRSFNAVRDEFTNSQKVILKTSRKYDQEMKKGHSERKSETIQIYLTLKGNLMQELQKELQTRLSSKLGNVNLLLLDDKSKVDDRMFLIIVCIATSRVGADATHIMKRMRNHENAVLLIIHCTDSSSKSNRNSSHHLTGVLYERLRGIFDLTYMRGYGFVACEMNDRSIIKLSEICKQPVYSEML